MSIVSIRAALESRLAAVAPTIDTVHENAPYTPTVGRTYQEAHLLFADPENPSLGRAFYRERGIFQVSLMYPSHSGSGEAAARAEIIRDAFPRGATFERNGIAVKIDATPEIRPGIQDGDRWRVPVRIRWHADIH